MSSLTDREEIFVLAMGVVVALELAICATLLPRPYSFLFAVLAVVAAEVPYLLHRRKHKKKKRTISLTGAPTLVSL